MAMRKQLLLQSWKEDVEASSIQIFKCESTRTRRLGQAIMHYAHIKEYVSQEGVEHAYKVL